MAIKYTGDLAKRIEPPKIGLLMQQKEIEQSVHELIDEKWRRMDLLFTAYGIEKRDWIGLCFALAESHVPGLMMAKAPAGRTTKWKDYDRAQLVLAVEDTGLSIKEAVAVLAKREPWSSMIERTRGPETLRDQYTRADKRWVAVARDAKEFESLTKSKRGAA